ncbi:hypothetical protein IAR50_004892 [Cryptococcus sp. DSM 104548]
MLLPSSSSDANSAICLPQPCKAAPSLSHYTQSPDTSRVTYPQQQQKTLSAGSSNPGHSKTHPPAPVYSTMPPPATLPSRPRASSNKKRKLLPSPIDGEASSSSFHSEEEDEDAKGEDEYAPSSSARPTQKAKKASRLEQPGAAGGGAKAKGKGSSREALRKANHSLIERRRREKINAALDELRDMVPGLGDNGGKGGEFKLEVLEKTVIHMKELKRQLAQLEHRLGASVPSIATSSPASSHQAEASAPEIDSHKTSPYPSPSPDKSHQPISPDPNETETESNLPPPLTRASSRPALPKRVTSEHYHSSPLLNPTSKLPPPPTCRPPPPATKSNPIFLPFPAPSPTSPFLQPHSHAHSAHGDTPGGSTGTSGTSGSTSGLSVSEASPFLAATGLSLFGGMVNVGESPADSFRPPPSIPGRTGSPPHLSLESQSHSSTPVPSRQTSVSPLSSFHPTSHPKAAHAPNPNLQSKATADMPAEEAANLLLAFSSPDTLRPIGEPQGGGRLDGGGRGRKETVEEFSLDGHGGVMNGQAVAMSVAGKAGIAASGGDRMQGGEVVGKSVRDILKLA